MTDKADFLEGLAQLKRRADGKRECILPREAKAILDRIEALEFAVDERKE